MKKTVKIILIIVLLMVWVAINGIIVKTNGSPGIIGLALGFACLAGVRAIWKYEADE